MNKPINAVQTFGLALAAILLLPMEALAAPLSHEIKIDHFGYRPADTKIAFCGDGILQDAEGTGAVCDDNF